MKITIECNKVEQKKWIDNAAEAAHYCVFDDVTGTKCSFDIDCKECLLKNIEWHINDERSCYSCGQIEDEGHLLNIHTLLYSNEDVLICDECYTLLREHADRLEKEFGGGMNEND